MEAQVPDECLREGMLATVAKQNANEPCRQAILSLPLEPEPTLQAMLQDRTIKHRTNEPAYMREDVEFISTAWLALTDALHLRDDHWHFVTVNADDPGTWRNIRSKYIVLGDTKYTPLDITIAPCLTSRNPDQGQIIAQAIPISGPPVHPEDLWRKSAKQDYQGQEFKHINGLLDTGADVTVIPERDWPSRWELQNVAGKIQGVFRAATIEERPTQKLNWLTDTPVWLVEEQLAKGNIQETTSPWNSPVFVLKKPGKDEWRLLHDLRSINAVIEDMGSPQPGMPSPAMLPQNWNLAIIDIKNCFFQIPLHPDDAPRFAFSVPSINREAPMKRYHWKVLPQGMKNSPSICQWYVSSLLSPVRAATIGVIIHHYMDDILICAPNDDLLTHALELTTSALVAAGFELRKDKIQKMPPWRYLGLEISISNEDLAPLFNLLKGGDEPSSPRELTPEAKAALERVQEAMSARQAHRCDPGLPFKFIIMGRLPHLHGIIFQWMETLGKGTDQGKRDPLLIIEWVFLSHTRSKRLTKPQELVAELIRKARMRIRELAGEDFKCIYIPLKLELGQFTKAMLEHLLRENESLQFALDSYTGEISVLRPAHKIFDSDVQLELKVTWIQSKKPLKALTVFTDASGGSHKSVVTWKDPQTQRWESDVAVVEGSPQLAELAAVVRAFEREFASFLQQWGIEHKTGIAYSPSGQAVVERTHQNIKRMLKQQLSASKHESPQVQLARALFTLNFLNCSFECLNPPIVRHFGASEQSKVRERPPVLVKDPETWRQEGPYDLVTWGRGYACVSTPSGLRWVPSKFVRPYVPKNSDKRPASPQAFNELAGLECWVVKQANLTSAALSNLLTDEETTRQATLQNRAAIDFLLLLHNHRCEEFAGLCCMNLSSKAEDVRVSISRMQEMIHHIQKESTGWLDSLFEGWGLAGWIRSLIQTGIVLLLGLIAFTVGFGVIKRLLLKALNNNININHAAVADPGELQPLNINKQPKEDPNDVWFDEDAKDSDSPV
ncbi:Endogenous retrovirus group K member 25 Pol protein [Lonchura striata]|uniref:ribonuclease H n=1 Tax=Lonchura striata TaxID=40157 RepID=A0A218UDA1_9PASE|nr:Endogenous retrovirus group K member 25 Pol protein [Lonchura striata domestica]